MFAGFGHTLDYILAGLIAVAFFSGGVAFGVHLQSWWASDDEADD